MMWMWFVLAGLCLGLELMTGTFYLLFLTIGLVMGGVIAWLNLSIYWSIFGFGLTSLLCVFVFRLFGISKQSVTRDATDDVNVNLDIGSWVIVDKWEHRQASVNYRGAKWQAQLASDAQDKGAGTYQIVDIIGSILILRPKS